MTTTDTDKHAPPEQVHGLMARLGATMADRFKLVVIAWIAVVVALGAAAPSVFSSLAGAGWQADGSESVQVRELAQQHFTRRRLDRFTSRVNLWTRGGSERRGLPGVLELVAGFIDLGGTGRAEAFVPGFETRRHAKADSCHSARMRCSLRSTERRPQPSFWAISSFE